MALSSARLAWLTAVAFVGLALGCGSREGLPASAEPADGAPPELDGGDGDAGRGDALPDGEPPGLDCSHATVVHEGDLTIETDEDLGTLHELAGVTGDLVLRGVTAAALSADCLATVGGQVLVERVHSTSLSFPSLTSIGGKLRPSYNDALTSISMPALRTIAGDLELHVNRALTSVELPALRDVGGDIVVLDVALASFDLPALSSVRVGTVTTVEGGITISQSSALTSVSFPALTTLGDGGMGIFDCRALTSISASELTTVSAGIHLTDLPALSELSLPRLATLGGSLVVWSAALTELSLPRLASLGGLFLQSVALTELSLPRLTSLGDVSLRWVTLTALSLPNVESLGALEIVDCEDMTSLSLPDLTRVAGNLLVDDNAALRDVTLPRFTSLGGLWFAMRDNPALAQCLVDAWLAAVQAEGFAGNVDVTNNRAGCDCTKWRAACP